MTNLDDLEAKAKAATPGPWIEDDGNVFSVPLNEERWATIERRLGGDEPHPDGEQRGEPLGWICGTQQGQPKFDEDCEFIAAANPVAVLELVAEVRRLAAFRNEALAVLREYLKLRERGLYSDNPAWEDVDEPASRLVGSQ